ncbi:MAG TPA: hypothetical protein VMV57_04615 [Terracidiphilus sp.]|nr:hypothetical protein [Terracidiphilus sp.]
MNRCYALPLLALCAVSVLAQAPAPASQTHTSDLGFSYSLPSDWTVVQTPSSLADVKQSQSEAATSEAEKKGIECVQIALTARHGNPASIVAVVQLPQSCFGQPITDKDLPGFAEGAMTNFKRAFVLSDPVYGSYFLGSHSLWIERVNGVAIGHAESHYTVEITCSVLRKGAVCWMVMATDHADLADFEQGRVTLDGETPAALVPASAFDVKPTP